MSRKMARKLRAWSRVIGPAAVLTAVIPFLVWRLGTGPFIDGVRSVDVLALAAATGIGVLTTLCCAWRWRTVARSLDVELSMGTAVAAYYRSIFINVTVPGGVVGDVHRGFSHGRDAGNVGRGLRAVARDVEAAQMQAELDEVI